MAPPTHLQIVTPSEARARALPGLLRLPPEVKIEVVDNLKDWQPHPARPVILDLAAPDWVQAKLNAALDRQAAPPVLLLGEPWQLPRQLAARLSERLVFTPLPLQENNPARAAADLLEGFSPPAEEAAPPEAEAPLEAKPAETEAAQKPEAEQPAPPTEEARPGPDAPADRSSDEQNSVEEMIDKLEMLLGEEDD